VAWGDDAALARRVSDHLDAGANHVCIQIVTGKRDTLPLDGWRRMAAALAF
jgi:hypothetical protein